MKRVLTHVFLFLIASIAVSAQPVTNFSGKWVFDPGQSKNVGMMSQAQIRTTVHQTKTQVVVDDASTFNGQSDTQHTVYDLTGKPTDNQSMMAGPAKTRSHWQGPQLITEWESAGAIAGTTSKRTETRYLSADGNTMFVESGKPDAETMIIVFKRDR